MRLMWSESPTTDLGASIGENLETRDYNDNQTFKEILKLD